MDFLFAGSLVKRLRFSNDEIYIVIIDKFKIRKTFFYFFLLFENLIFIKLLRILFLIKIQLISSDLLSKENPVVLKG